MKIRTGFVSNSSSSSFLVCVNDLWKKLKGENPRQITEEQERILLDFGFEYTCCPGAKHIEWNKHWNDNSYKDYFTGEIEYCTDQLGYSVTCNEHEVLEFLVKNQIPFEALCHYGHYSILWDGKEKIQRIKNPGLQKAMYRNLEIGDDDAEIFKEYTVEEFLDICC